MNIKMEHKIILIFHKNNYSPHLCEAHFLDALRLAELDGGDQLVVVLAGGAEHLNEFADFQRKCRRRLIEGGSSKDD